jgi:hypothetical protein
VRKPHVSSLFHGTSYYLVFSGEENSTPSTGSPFFCTGSWSNLATSPAAHCATVRTAKKGPATKAPASGPRYTPLTAATGPITETSSTVASGGTAVTSTASTGRGRTSARPASASRVTTRSRSWSGTPAAAPTPAYRGRWARRRTDPAVGRKGTRAACSGACAVVPKELAVPTRIIAAMDGKISRPTGRFLGELSFVTNAKDSQKNFGTCNNRTDG